MSHFTCSLQKIRQLDSEIDTDFIPTVLDSLLLVEFRKTIREFRSRICFCVKRSFCHHTSRKFGSNYGIFVDFPWCLQRKISDFKSCLKCWQAIHNHSNAFIRRSSAFGKRENKYTGSVPVKTAPFKGPVLTGTRLLGGWIHPPPPQLSTKNSPAL